MIDTHAHLDKSMSLKNISKIINISLDLSFAEKHKKVFNAIGYHPYEIKNLNLEKLKKLTKNSKVIAIGEIGLDDSAYAKASADKQKNAFLRQFKLAQELNLPVILHCRGLHDEFLKILKKYRGVIHCFTGNLKQAQKYLDLGFYLSFTGIITYSDSYDKVIKNIKLSKILLETDCPFLVPEPIRSQKKRLPRGEQSELYGEPWMVKFVAQKIAKIKKISYKKVVQKTTKNAKKVFKI